MCEASTCKHQEEVMNVRILGDVRFQATHPSSTPLLFWNLWKFKDIEIYSSTLYSNHIEASFVASAKALLLPLPPPLLAV